MPMCCLCDRAHRVRAASVGQQQNNSDKIYSIKQEAKWIQWIELDLYTELILYTSRVLRCQKNATANKHRRKSAYTLIVQSMILPITCEVMVHFRVDGLYRSPLGSMGALKWFGTTRHSQCHWLSCFSFWFFWFRFFFRV